MHSSSFEDFAFLMDGIKNGKKELILPISEVEHWDLEVLSELPKVTRAVSKTGAEPVFLRPDQGELWGGAYNYDESLLQQGK